MHLRVRALSVRVATLMLLMLSPDLLSVQAQGASCGGGAGGYLRAGRTDVVYSVSDTDVGRQLDAVVLIRGPAEWRRLLPPDSSPMRWRPDGTPRPVSGATAGPLWVGYERGAGTLWLGADSVALGAANVAMVEVDSAGQAHVVGTTHVEPRLQSIRPPCRALASEKDVLEFRATLLKVVRSDASVRAFLDR
jgi:hypothetical protein